MEVIKLGKNEIESRFHEQERLKEIIEQLDLDAKKNNQVICRIKVNGLSLSEDDEIKFAQTERSEISEIEVEMHRISELMAGTLSSLEKYIDMIKPKVERAAELFRENNKTDSNRLLSEVVTGAERLIQALISVHANLSANTKTAEFEARWISTEKHMISSTRELVAAYERQDFVLVSDVLEYEMTNTLDSWREILKSIS